MLDLDRARDRIRELSRQYGLQIDPDAVVETLSVGEQQRVELIKALYRDADILILDEPTAVLTPGEVDEFFGVVRGLVEQGKSIIFITHKLREVLAVADHIVVLRGGEVVGTADPKTATQQSLATLMVGRDVSFTLDKAPAARGEPVLSVSQLWVDDDRGVTTVADFDLEVHAGEVFGIAGVEGNGQRELVEALMGMRPKRQGGVVIAGRNVTHAIPREIIDLGVGHVPEDRGKHGIVGPFSIADNLVLNRYRRRPFARRGLRDADAIERRRRGARAGVRRAHAEPERPGVEPLRRQPAEGDHRPRAHRRREAAGGGAADPRARRRLDRVHPPAHHRDARPGRRRAAGVGRARRGPRRSPIGSA